MHDRFSLDGRTAVVTHACDPIAAHCADVLAEAGAVVRALDGEVAAETIAAMASLDILVNATAIAGSNRTATVLADVFRVCQEAGRLMFRTGRGGVIVNLVRLVPASQPGEGPTIAEGVIQLTRGVALELARQQIRANTLAFGFLEAEAQPSVAPKRLPLGRTGRLEEIDGALLLLASDAGSYVTGATVTVDGGAFNALA